MTIIPFLVFFFSLSARAEISGTSTSVSTGTETSVWKRVDKSLNDGVHTAKRKFMDADNSKKKPAKKTGEGAKGSSGHELEKVTDSLNDAWDSTVKGVGKVLKSQSTGTKDSTATATNVHP